MTMSMVMMMVKLSDENSGGVVDDYCLGVKDDDVNVGHNESYGGYRRLWQML